MLVVASKTKNHIHENYCIHKENNHNNYYKNKTTQTKI
jgi:hypothetical protein